MVREAPVVAVDVGTSKVSVVIAQIENDGRVGIVGIGSTPSKGIRKGVILELDQAVASIKEAITQAAGLAGVPINQVYASLSGTHLKAQTSSNKIKIRSSEVSQNDMNRVMEEAGDIVVSDDREVLHILSQGFSLDGVDDVLEPTGLAGEILEGKALVVTGAIRTAQNLVKALNRSGVVVKDVLASPIAAAKGVLTREEKEIGVCHVDIGAGTTTVTIFYGGVPIHMTVLPVGGTLISGDVAAGLRIPLTLAEDVKIKFGAADVSEVDLTKTFATPQVQGQASRVTSQSALADIIIPRINEIFGLVENEISKVAFRSSLLAGCVLTGGTAKLPGIAKACEIATGLPARIGVPSGLAGLSDLVASPEYSCGVGLIFDAIERRPSFKRSTPSLFSRVANGGTGDRTSPLKAVSNFFGKYF